MNQQSDSQQTAYRGVVLVGLPRSGTTLLRRLLNAHANLNCPSETNLFGACARFLRTEQFPGGVPVGVTSALGFLGFDEADVRGRLRELAFGFLDEHTSRSGAARWVEKSPLDIFYLDEIADFLKGHVRFVCLYRHALDVAISTKELVEKTGGYLQDFHRYLRMYPQPLEAHVRLWMDGTRAMRSLASSQPEHALEIRYENLIENTATELRRLLDFIGEPWEEGLVERALATPQQLGLGDWKTYQKNKIDAASVGQWRNLPEATISYLADIANGMLAECGYPEIPVSSNQNADETRRYLLGLMVQDMKKHAAGQKREA